MSNSTLKMLLGMLGLTLVIGAGAGGYFLYQQQQQQMALENQLKELQAAQNIQNRPLDGGDMYAGSTGVGNVSDPQTMEAPSVMIAPTPAKDLTMPEQKRVDVIWKVTPPAKDMTQLQARVINPYFDYNQTAQGVSQVTSFTIEAGQGDYPYNADYKLSTGAYGGFVIMRQAGGDIDWWVPECMNDCGFTASFKQKYPEIVKVYEN